MTPPHDLRPIVEQFQTPGAFVGALAFGSGHINDTYCATFDAGGAQVRHVYQRVNRAVFKDPASLMDNIRRVTEHLHRKLSRCSDARRRALTLIPTRDGRPYYEDPQGDFWRASLLIEGARTYDAAVSTGQAFEAAQAFGRFQAMLADLPEPPLHETIPDFHHTPKRFAALERAVETDPLGRASTAAAEIEFALRRRPMTGALVELEQQGEIPRRTTHNDTKLNNVLFDEATGRGLCVLDLDTVMPGLALYDFGDMVRTTTSPAEEDERDLARVEMQMPMFEALARGYLSAAGGFLGEPERRRLAFAGKLITFEQGVRFLADFLGGDKYYRIHRNGQNLDRCRTQFKLVESIERQQSQMERLAETIYRGLRAYHREG